MRLAGTDKSDRVLESSATASDVPDQNKNTYQSKTKNVLVPSGLFSRRKLNSGLFLWDIFVAQLTNKFLALVEFLVFVSPPSPGISLSLSFSLSRSLAGSLPCYLECENARIVRDLYFSSYQED